MFLWTIVILLVFIFITLGVIFRFQILQVKKKEEELKEAFWERRHKIPLLLELVSCFEAERAQIIDIRNKLSSDAYTLSEQIELEEKLGNLLKGVFKKAEVDPELKTSVLFLSIKRELEASFEKIRIVLGVYKTAERKKSF